MSFDEEYRRASHASRHLRGLKTEALADHTSRNRFDNRHTNNCLVNFNIPQKSNVLARLIKQGAKGAIW